MNFKRRLTLPFVALAIGVAGCGGSPASKVVKPPVKSPNPPVVTARAHPPGFGLPPKGLKPRAVRPGLVPTLEMFDSVEVSTVPFNPAAVAGYTGGSWQTYFPLVNAFPHAFHLPIAPEIWNPTYGPITCLDVEPGDAHPWDAGPWALQQIAVHIKPCIYANLSTMPSVQASLNASGLPRSAYFLWDANWTYVAHLDVGYDLTQWTDRSLGRNLDESTVATYVFGPVGPSPQQIASWRSAKKNSEQVFLANHGCGSTPGSKFCSVFVNRTVYFEQQLVRNKVEGQPHCFGNGARLSWRYCQVVRPAVAGWSRARDASYRAFHGNHCTVTQGGSCAVWRDRVVYFQSRITEVLH